MTNTTLSANLAREIEERVKYGQQQVTMRQFDEMLREIGYQFDREMDCKCTARYMTGDRAGETYPSHGLYPCQIDDGVSCFNVGARRDANYDKLKHIRDNYFAVSRGFLVEF